MFKTRSVLEKPRASLVVASLVFLLWSAFIIFLMNSHWGEGVEKLNQRINFSLRDHLEHPVLLDSRVKIIGFDDKTISALQAGDLSYSQWVDFLAAISEMQPRTIIIDKIFSVGGSHTVPPKERIALDRKIAALKTPITVGSYTYPYPIKGRELFRLSNQVYSFSHLGFDKRNINRFTQNLGEHVYGPSPSYRSLFNRVGHIHYEGSNKIKPLLSVGADKVLPHLAFAAFPEIKFRPVKNALYFGETPLPINRNAELQINWINKKEFFSKTIAARGELEQVFSKKKLKNIQKGDVVIILPMLYTGNTDFKDSPYGMVPGGMHLVSLINSVLQQKWLLGVEYAEILVLIFVMLGVVIGSRCRPVFVAIFLMISHVAVASAGIALFTLVDVSFYWSYLCIALMGSTLFTSLARSRDAERKALIIKSALDGVVTTDKAERLSRRPQMINLDAKERVVTIVFIDVVGFSLVAENQLPKRAFEELKFTLDVISQIIYYHGGIVNKNLGDGLLCIFGYDFENDKMSVDHAEKAMIASIRIQEQNLKHNLDAGENGGMVLPLRIGIHSTSVYMGNLGNGSRIDFTVIGNGVNFAKRLEGACYPNSILISDITYDLITNLMLDKRNFSEKQVKIKHHSDRVIAYEYDPFYAYKHFREQAENAFRKCVNAARAEQRWTLNNPSLILVKTNYGPAQMINFSSSGMSVKLQKGLGRGEQLVISLECKYGHLEKALARENLHQILCEIAWSYEENGVFVHGLRFTGIALEKAEILVGLIKESGMVAGGSIIGTGSVSKIKDAG